VVARLWLASVVLSAMAGAALAMDTDLERGFIRSIGNIQTDAIGPDVTARAAIERWAETIQMVEGSRRDLVESIVRMWRADVNRQMIPARHELGRLRRHLRWTRVASGGTIFGMLAVLAAFFIYYHWLSCDCPNAGTPAITST